MPKSSNWVECTNPKCNGGRIVTVTKIVRDKNGNVVATIEDTKDCPTCGGKGGWEEPPSLIED